MSNIKPSRIIGLLALGALGIGAALDYKHDLGIFPRYYSYTNEGSAAHDFLLETTDGMRAELKSGMPAVINFWHAGCPPCNKEMPHFQRLYDRAGELGINFVSINVSDAAQAIEKYKRERGFTFPVAMDEPMPQPRHGDDNIFPAGRAATAYRVTGYPTTCFVGRDRKMGCISGDINYRILLRGIESHR